jgi:diguanylate cyclase (GGDEF)-like protein
MPRTLEQLIASDKLPSLPQVAVRVLEIARSPEPDIDELVRVIKADPGISGRIMQTVNSALFGLRQRVSSIEAAIPLLGITLVRTLVLSFSLAGFCQPSSHHQRRARRLWRVAITQAVAAQLLAESTKGADPLVWFLGGLLQDVGRMALLNAEPDVYGQLLDESDEGPDLIAAEQRAFGYTHTDVATQLCQRWQIDPELIAAIRGHHAWCETPSPETSSELGLPLSLLPIALRTAAVIADYFESLSADRHVDRRLFQRPLSECFDCPPDQVTEWLADVNERVSEIAVLFRIDVGPVVPVNELLAQAQETLGEIAMQSQLEAVSAQRRAQDAAAELARLKSESDRLRIKASLDPLTGAHCRDGLRDAIAVRLSGRRYQDRRLGVIFMDVDKFKLINDTLGHKMGDEVLQRLVEVVKSNIREDDAIYRYGGDEFVIVLSTCGESLLARISERIRRHIEQAQAEPKSKLKFTSSIGLVICDPSRARELSADKILEEADRAMYVAKKQGGNQVAAFLLEDDDVVPFEPDEFESFDEDQSENSSRVRHNRLESCRR